MLGDRERVDAVVFPTVIPWRPRVEIDFVRPVPHRIISSFVTFITPGEALVRRFDATRRCRPLMARPHRRRRL